ncbi:MAG: S8 family serine peptidase [Planctomycetota bacterium]
MLHVGHRRTRLFAALVLAALAVTPPALADGESVHIAGQVAQLHPERFETVSGDVHAVVLFHEIPDETRREELGHLGLRLHQFLPPRAFFATVPAESAPQWLAEDDIASAEPFRPQWKSRPSIATDPGERLWHLPDGTRLAQVYFFPDVAKEDAFALLGTLDAAVLSDTWQVNERLLVRLTPDAARELVRRDAVRWIESGHRPRRAANVSAARVHNVDDVHRSPYNLDGTGAKVGVMDGDVVQDDHPAFGDRVTVIKSFTSSEDSHATHVTGTILGDGTGNANAKGMAPGAESFHWTFNDPDIVDAKSTGFRNRGLHLDNNSWSTPAGWALATFGWWYVTNPVHGEYMSDVGDLDDIARDEDVLINFAAGNEGYDDGYNGFGYYYFYGSLYYGHYDYDLDNGTYQWHTGYHQKDGGVNGHGNLSPEGSLKNGLTVGAIRDDTSRAPFSSGGPTADGRLKPDVVAVGMDVLSTVPHDAFDTFQGTSMAAPVVTGIGALFVEAWMESHRDQRPRMDILKGLLIHSAVDRGRPGPDYSFGFGVVDASYGAALALLDDGSQTRYVRTGSLLRNGWTEYLLDVPADTPLLRVTLCWTDLPGNPAAQTMLVNDLDLSLIDPDGVTHLPWKLDPTRTNRNATRGRNTADNVEMAEVSDPDRGMWKVRVRGDGIATGPQPFAVWFSEPYANFPPVADAGGDRRVSATAPTGGVVQLSGAASSDPNLDDTLTYQWDTDGDGRFDDEGGSRTGRITSVALPMGPHTVSLRVSDPLGESDTDTVTITVQNSPPTASLGGNPTYRATDPEGADLVLDTSHCTDPQTSFDIVQGQWDLDGDGEYDDALGKSIEARLNMGPNTVGLTVLDTAGASDSTVETITITGPENDLGRGGSFKGEINDADDVDTFFFEALANSQVKVTLKPRHPLTLRVTIEDPDGGTAMDAITSDAKKTVAETTLEKTGWHWMEVAPRTSAIGPYTMAFKVKPPSLKDKALFSLNDFTPTWTRDLDLLEGAKLSVRLKSALKDKPTLELRDEDGNVIATDEKGKGKLKLSGAPHTGTYTLVVSAEDETKYGTAVLSWKGKQPKGKVKVKERE